MTPPQVTWRDIIAWLALAALIAIMYAYGTVREKAKGEVWNDSINVKSE